jgi:hypothetical protein
MICRHSAHEGGKMDSIKRGPSLLPGKIPRTYLFYRLSRVQKHIAAVSIK